MNAFRIMFQWLSRLAWVLHACERKCTTRAQRIYFIAFVTSPEDMHYLDIDKSPIKMSNISFRFSTFFFFGDRAAVQVLTTSRNLETCQIIWNQKQNQWMLHLCTAHRRWYKSETEKRSPRQIWDHKFNYYLFIYITNTNSVEMEWRTIHSIRFGMAIGH